MFQSLADSHAMTVSARTNLNLVTAADDHAYISAAAAAVRSTP